MLAERIQIRQYQSVIALLLKNLNSLTKEEKSRELSRWRDWDLHVLVFDPLDAQNCKDYAKVREDASEMGLRIYPAFRTQPASWSADDPFHFASYMTREFWQINAARLTSVAALRLPGDPWIGIDMENYAPVPDSIDPPVPALVALAAERRPAKDGPEPTADALDNPDPALNRHFTIAQLRAAMQPFIDAIRATNSSVALYPTGATSGEDLFYVADTFAGEHRVELWTESNFGLSEDYRQSSARKFPANAAAFLKLMGHLRGRFPGCIVRPGISDLERIWSDPYRSELLRSGPYAPWGFDHTRYDRADVGLPSYRTGLRLSDPEHQVLRLNDVLHVWPIQPLRGDVPSEFDTTEKGDRAELSSWAADKPVNMARFPPAATLHLDGIQFGAPPPPEPGKPPLWVWAGLAAQKVLPEKPEPFTLDGTLRLPVDLAQSCPLFGAAWYNMASWQVAYDAARDVIALYVHNPHPKPGELKYHVRDLMTTPSRGVDLRFQIGRFKDNWLHQASASPGSPIATIKTSSVLPDAGGQCPNLVIGAGRASNDLSQNVGMAHCPGILLVKTWSIYDRLLSDSELAELLRPRKPKADPKTWEWRYWPYGYGR